MDLGTVVGLLLDGDRSGHGTYTLDEIYDDGQVDTSRCAFNRRRGVWWLRSATETVVCDGTTVHFTQGDQVIEMPGRAQQPPQQLWVAFPFQLPVWGRRGDDFRLGTEVVESGPAVTVPLIPRNNRPLGSLTIDITSGMVRTFSQAGKRLSVRNLNPRWSALEDDPAPNQVGDQAD